MSKNKPVKADILLSVAKAAVNIGDAMNNEFNVFMDVLDNYGKAELLRVNQVNHLKQDVMDIVKMTAHMVAISSSDKEFVKNVGKLTKDKTLQHIIHNTKRLMECVPTQALDVVRAGDVAEGDGADTFVGEFNSIKEKVSKVKDKDILKYYAQDKALLEVAFNVNALVDSMDDVKRQDLQASFRLITPNSHSVLATQTLLELVTKLSAQALAKHLSQEPDKDKAKADFVEYLTRLMTTIVNDADALFSGELTYVEHSKTSDTL